MSLLALEYPPFIPFYFFTFSIVYRSGKRFFLCMLRRVSSLSSTLPGLTSLLLLRMKLLAILGSLVNSKATLFTFPLCPIPIVLGFICELSLACPVWEYRLLSPIALQGFQQRTSPL
ncbi:MAG: hypothetical protein JOS17DRAFT_114747 [Linnemannia elongata]|nr:MAG: hypothetical protein JOS17DRAFT_114747 [Linnemannia elongata]